MFFAALFPQFIDPAAPTLPQLGILGGTYLLVDCLILLAWGSHSRRSLRRGSGRGPSGSSTGSAER